MSVLTQVKQVSRLLNTAADRFRGAHASRSYEAIAGDAVRARTQIHALPTFGADGKLPAGIHDADLGSFLVHVGGNEHRKGLYGPFGDRLLQLQRHGVREVFVAGSGIGAKPKPGDVDALFRVADRSKLPMRARLVDWMQGTHWHGAERRHFAPQTSWGLERPTWLNYMSHYATEHEKTPVAVVRVILNEHPATAGARALRPPA